MPREFASPDLANLIAARVPKEEFERRVRAPLTAGEIDDVAELVEWFTRRYPTGKERLAYARRKLREYRRTSGSAPVGAVLAGYRETAERLARAHRANDPETLLVLLDPDPEEKQIRLLEVTRSAPTTHEPFAVDFFPRPDLGVPFALAILVVSPDEWDAIRAGRIDLPERWVLDRLEPLAPPAR